MSLYGAYKHTYNGKPIMGADATRNRRTVCCNAINSDVGNKPHANER